MKKNEIIIEDGLNLYKKTGTGNYTITLYKFLKKLGYRVYVRRKHFLEKIQNSTIKRILYILWLNFIFPFTVLNNNSHSIIFTNTITPLFKIPGKNYYPVLHDLWAFKAPKTVTFMQGLYTRIVIYSIKKTYRKIITVSNTIKKEIIEFLDCKEDDVNVIYNYFSFGENPNIQMTEDEQQKILDLYEIKSKKYILSVATLNKRKNIPMLIDAYNKLNNSDIKLVLVGSKNSEKFNCNNKNIVFTGYINNNNLKILYKNALIYAFPSIYEGFGIPIIDAQSFNIPIICSNISVFREIAGNGALYCDLNVDSFANGLNSLIENQNLRQSLIQEGKNNILKYAYGIIKESILSCDFF